jgi:hypothetical protein
MHFALATCVIPLADAALGSGGGPIHGPHLEVPGHEKCPPIHNHLNCSAFSTARLLASPPRYQPVPGSDVLAQIQRALESLGRPLPAVVSSLGSRAPPLA